MEEIETKLTYTDFLRDKVSKGLTNKYKWDDVLKQHLSLFQKALN